MSGVCVHILYSNKGIHYCSFHILSCRLRVFGLVWLQRNKKSKTKFNCLYQIWQWELHFCLRKHNLPALHWSHYNEWLKRNFSSQNHNILRQKHDEGEPNNGCNHLLVVNNLITWLTYQYSVIISKEMIYYLSNAFAQIPCYWV